MTSGTLVSTDRSACARCGSQLAPALLSCPACHTLVHGERLKELAAAAKTAEDAGDRTMALTQWREAISLLPPTSAQYPVIAARIDTLGREHRQQQAEQQKKAAEVSSSVALGQENGPAPQHRTRIMEGKHPSSCC